MISCEYDVMAIEVSAEAIEAAKAQILSEQKTVADAKLAEEAKVNGAARDAELVKIKADAKANLLKSDTIKAQLDVYLDIIPKEHLKELNLEAEDNDAVKLGILKGVFKTMKYDGNGGVEHSSTHQPDIQKAGAKPAYKKPAMAHLRFGGKGSILGAKQ